MTLYAIVAFRLRRTITQSAMLGDKHTESLHRVVRCMVIYPIAYVVLSLPIAAGRMAMVRGITPSPAYFCAAAAIITSSGVVDVTIYTLTRRNLITASETSHNHRRDRFGISTPRKDADHLATMAAEPTSNCTGVRMFRGRSHNVSQVSDEPVLRGSSTDNIVHGASEEWPDLSQTYRLTTIEVTSERAYPPS